MAKGAVKDNVSSSLFYHDNAAQFLSTVLWTRMSNLLLFICLIYKHFLKLAKLKLNIKMYLNESFEDSPL